MRELGVCSFMRRYRRERAKYVDVNIIHVCQQLQILLSRQPFWSATPASVFMCSELPGLWQGASMMPCAHSA